MVMIDVAAAEAAMAQIAVGGMVTLELDGTTVERKVIEKTLYNVTVQGPTNTLCCPIEFTLIYRKEVEAMGLRISPETATRKPRAAKATGPQAPAAAEAAEPKPRLDMAATGWKPPKADPAPAQASQAAQAVTIAEEATDAMTWPTQEIDGLLEGLRASLLTMAETLIDDLPEAPAAAPAKPSCLDCQHMDLPNDMCGKFKVKIPLVVALAAKEKCADFLADEIPF